MSLSRMSNILFKVHRVFFYRWNVTKANKYIIFKVKKLFTTSLLLIALYVDSSLTIRDRNCILITGNSFFYTVGTFIVCFDLMDRL